VTGAAAPTVIDLPARVVVHVALAAPRAAAAELPWAAVPELDAADAARVAMFAGGAVVAEARLPRDDLALRPAPRAFGHMFSRWLRAGGHESGFDLTPFASLARGVKHRRIASAPADVDQIVSYALAIAG
jgi:hypothetical protein